MPPLENARHERFAQEVAKGSGHEQAYKLAGYKYNKSAASRLANDVNVCERVLELQERAAVRVELTLADIIAEIERSGCDMLKGKMDGTESKETIVKYLKKCDCPVLKSKFSGIEKK